MADPFPGIVRFAPGGKQFLEIRLGWQPPAVAEIGRSGIVRRLQSCQAIFLIVFLKVIPGSPLV